MIYNHEQNSFSKKTNWGITMKGTTIMLACLLVFVSNVTTALSSTGGDLDEIKAKGVLRQLGVPYANFVSGNGPDGLSIELMQLFAAHLGVRYEYVESTWKNVFSDLIGRKYELIGDEVKLLGEATVRGDVISNGLTFLPWRQKLIDYSTPTFPTQVWLIAGIETTITPVHPSGDITLDIAATKKKLRGKTVLGIKGTCLDPVLYDLAAHGAEIRYFDGSLNDVAPATINMVANAALLDVPDAMIALRKWPGKIVVIGPVSPEQEMGEGFRKESVQLREEYNRFFTALMKNGQYSKLVIKYYPDIKEYYPNFFN
jgi:ABC-type amino acid transport substrate-binding protein